MIDRRKGGLTEFILSPWEKREELICEHSLRLVENLHRRIMHLERRNGHPTEEAGAFAVMLERIPQSAIAYNLTIRSSIDAS